MLEKHVSLRFSPDMELHTFHSNDFNLKLASRAMPFVSPWPQAQLASVHSVQPFHSEGGHVSHTTSDYALGDVTPVTAVTGEWPHT